MTHLNLENLIKTCETASLNAPYRAIMASIGASEDLCYHWRTLSMTAERENNKSSIFYFEWRAGQWSYWHRKIAQARIDFIQGYEAEIRHECRFGRTEIVLGPDQQIVYRLDPKLISLSDEDLKFLWGRDHRYLLDEDGMPVPLTRQVFPPAPIRLRILEQDKRYLATQNIDVNVQGEVVHTPQPLQRRVGEERPDVAALRALAKIPPKHPFPLNAHGHRTIASGLPPGRRDDDLPQLEKPSPYAAPYSPPEAKQNAPDAPRPSYAKPVKSLDQAGIGRGEPPEGGFKMA